MNDNLPKRKRNRLTEYDYSNNGYYFITICIDNKKEYLGTISNSTVVLNDYGKIVEMNWSAISERFQSVELDEYVIMPNHFHGIVIIDTSKTENLVSLSKIIGVFKSLTTIEIHKKGLKEFRWQRSFYDRIIRNEKELFNIRRYIVQNPLAWEIEKDNPENLDM